MRPPLIIIGMHRSGTSLITTLLNQAGVFMGADQGISHSESLFFLNLNKMVYNLAHAEWDIPAPLEWLLEDADMVDQVSDVLRVAIDNNLAGDYLGLDTSVESDSLEVLSSPWGWKDPRNTYTLKMWLNLFPDAKVLNIVRNGVDVANSLRVREQKRKSRFDSPARSVRCISIERSFDLWVEYVSMSINSTKMMDQSKVMHLRYEDILTNPALKLSDIFEFANFKLGSEQTASLCSFVDVKRKYAFVRDPELYSFYREVLEHPLMRLYQYNNILKNDGDKWREAKHVYG